MGNDKKVDIQFKDKVAVITGAGNGLGRSYALFLASRGARIVVNDIGVSLDGKGYSDEPARRVVAEIQSLGGDAVPNMDNAADKNGAKALIDSAIEAFGDVHILICNAGFLRDRSFAKMPLEDFEAVVNVHLMGTVYPTRIAFPMMKENGFGRIVMTTSTAGLFGNFGQTNYAAAKMGILGFMNALKLEGIKSNILINTVAPLAATRLADSSGIFPEDVDPLVRPDWVAALVAYLCSEKCERTGQVISAGGGHYAGVQILESPGISLRSDTQATPEEIAQRFDEICDMRDAKTYASAIEEGQALLASFGRCNQGRM